MIAARLNFTAALIAAECRVLGAEVGPLPAGVDGAQLLWAIAGVESSFGKDCQPRHEPAYDVGGRYAPHYPMTILLPKFGSSAACSYGPWQLMLCNAPLTFSPGSFDSLRLAAQATVSQLCSMLRRFQPKSLAEIGDCWNAGHITADPAYEHKLAAAYATAMPVVTE